MGMGKLSVNVFIENVGQPILGADIVIKCENNDKLEFKTDEVGKTEPIELDCPDREYSLYPQNEVRPYGKYTLEVSKDGMRKVIIHGIEIFDETESIQNVFMKAKDSAYDEQDEIIIIPEHVLWTGRTINVEINSNSQMSSLDQTGVRDVPFVPSDIIVHNGPPSAVYAPNYVVPFLDYIKNVAACEIYSTWPYECIKANVYIILSIAMNRVCHRWYEMKGYRFTITSLDSLDQRYLHGRNTSLPISQVVDEIFRDYIIETGDVYPFFAKKNGRIEEEQDQGPDGQIDKWEAIKFADEGYSAFSIIQNYFGADKYIDTAELVEGMYELFPKYVLKPNMSNEYVQRLQMKLNIISYSYSCINKIVPADGVFEESTREAVERFQETFYMPATGEVDFSTWYRVSDIYNAVIQMLNQKHEETESYQRT